MKIIAIRTGAIIENAYIILNEERNECIVIDPGDDAERILAAITGSVKAILLTHGHFDHIGAVREIKEATGARVYIHAADAPMLLDSKENLSAVFGMNVTAPAADVILSGRDVIECAGMTVKVIYTPGHSMGSVCYIIGDCLFSGDTIFYMYVGRTDFPSSSEAMLRSSIINALGTLKENYKIYPGHGIATTLDFEKKNNIFLYE